MGRRPRRHRRPVSTATRKRISAALRGKKHPHRGVKPSPAARAHESAAHRGKRHPHRGHRMSAATRAKISRALKGRHHKRHCHCGSSSKHSLTRRRVRHGQHGGIVVRSDAGAVLRVTKHRDRKRHKLHGKVHGLHGHRGKHGAQRKTGPCHCPKRNRKKHARLRRTHHRRH